MCRIVNFPKWHVCLLFSIFFMLFEFIYAGYVENQTASLSNETKQIKPINFECNDTQKMVDECFKDFPPHLMEFLQTTKIAVNANEIASKCIVFDRGMKCFDEYSSRCLPRTKLNILQNNVEGARNFFLKFCGDLEFQKHYLRHRECFSHIQDDWIRCTQNFRNILSEELHEENTNVTNKFMEFCCARYAFENCIYTSARYKCYKKSVEFARDTAKMLSDEKHFSNCRQYENAICVTNDCRPLWRNWIGWYFLCAALVLVRFRYLLFLSM